MRDGHIVHQQSRHDSLSYLLQCNFACGKLVKSSPDRTCKAVDMSQCTEKACWYNLYSIHLAKHVLQADTHLHTKSMLLLPGRGRASTSSTMWWGPDWPSNACCTIFIVAHSTSAWVLRFRYFTAAASHLPPGLPGVPFPPHLSWLQRKHLVSDIWHAIVEGLPFSLLP